MTMLQRLLLPVLLWLPGVGNTYPLDGYAESGIRRVEGARLAVEGVITGTKQPPGALKPLAQVDLRLLDHRDLDLPAPDPAFTAQVVRLLGGEADRYGVAVLDLSDPAQPRYAEHRGEVRQNVGSVGKLVVALAIFQVLADIWPDDIEKRTQVLRSTVVTADSFIHIDHHKVRLFDVADRKLDKRPLRDGDQGTLWEYLDWMLSASSNAAAAMCMREAMLLRHYGKDYPPPQAEIERFFNATPKQELTALFVSTFFEPVTRNGLDLEQLRQGSFFTNTGKRRVPGGGSSYGTARELMKYLLRMEQGRLVDVYSSREIKRLLYMTEWRIRYASSPALRNSAVYFKSGSLYQCKKEPDFKCGKYMGNVRNYMNSVAIVETDSGGWQLDYMVTLISNVLRKNSAVEHQTLATRIHRLIEKEHPVRAAAPAARVESVESAEAVEEIAPVDPPDTGDTGDSQ
jgi:Beta-lactamase enzyme family